MTKRIPSILCGLAIVLGLAGSATAEQTPTPSRRALSVAAASKHPKLSAELHELAGVHRSRGTVAAQAFAVERGIALSLSSVQVVIQTSAGDVEAVKSRVHAAGGTFELAGSDLVLARIPVAALETLASADEVKVVRRPRAPTPFRTTSEGVEAMGATAWHAVGRKGAGVKVAILDLGFDGYQFLMGSELPNIPAAHVKSFSGSISGDTEHGAGVAEIVYDVAPEADLYLVNFSNEVELEAAVQWLIDERVDVINASWGYPCNGPLDGTGFVNALVKRAADAGILWVNAAGNFAQRHWSGAFSDSNANGWHNFSAEDDGNPVYMSSGEELRVCAEWDDWTQKDQDFDLFVWDSSGTIVESSTENQGGPSTHDPFELLTFTANTTGYYFIGVKRDRGTRSAKIHLYAYPPGTECAIETVSEDTPAASGLLGELRQFRDRVLAPSPFGKALIQSYYRHSPEVSRILLLHPMLAIEAAALVKASRPAVRSVGSRGEPFVISEEYAARIDRFLDALTGHSSPGLRQDLVDFRASAALSAAAGQTAEVYWRSLLGQAPFDSATVLEVFPDAGYMRHITTETSLVPPADSPHAFTVGAISRATGSLEEFSSRGPTADGRRKPDIAALDGVCTTTYANCDAGGFSGTSAAAPHVTGAAALVRQAYPLRSLTELREFLSGRAIDLSPAGPDNQTGAGRLALGSTSEVDIFPGPALLAPVGNSQPISPTYKWSYVSGADSYRLMIATSASALPTDPATQSCSGCLVNTTTSTPFFTPPVPLLSLVTYYWQVQGRAAGKNGQWTRTSFKTTIWGELTPPERTDVIEESGPWPTPAGKAVVITHGWNANTESGAAEDQPWVKEMADKVCGKLAATTIVSTVKANALTKICQSAGWDVWVIDWSSKAGTVFPWNAFNHARPIGEMVALNFNAKKYQHVHFIAHSAGSNLIDSATSWLRRWRPTTKIHDTFLDAYEPASDASYYGARADWTDNYVDTRSVFDLHAGLDGTKLFLAKGYTIDVTPQTGGDPCAAFVVPPVCRHSRPYRFYGRSVDASFVGHADYASFDAISGNGEVGFPLSTESGRLLSTLGSYEKGKGCLMVGSSCIPTTAPATQQFNIVRTVRAVTAVVGPVIWVAKVGTSFLFDSIKLGFVSFAQSPAVDSIATGTAPSEPPAYIVADVTTTQPADKLRFSWRFNTGGEGFLRVFVDGMLVREIDQRHVPIASTEVEQVFVGSATGTLPPGTHRIAFRLDGFGSSASGVELTDIELGATAPATRRRAIRH